MLEKHEVCCGMFHGFDWSLWTEGPPEQRWTIIPAAQNHILEPEKEKDGEAKGSKGDRVRTKKERFLQAVMELSRAFALAVPSEEAIEIRDDVNFFQTVRAALLKQSPRTLRSAEEIDSAIRQIVSKAVASEGVVDIFAEAGLKNPDISVLSDEFLAEVRGMKHRNLAVELLQKLIRGELSVRSRRNAVQARSFTALLEGALLRYQNRNIETAQVIEELVGLAREIREASARGEELGLNGGRTSLLRRPRDQRQRGQGAGRRDPPDHRAGARRGSEKQCHDRLDGQRERQGPDEEHSPPDPEQVRVSARQAGEGDPDSAGAGGIAIGGMGERLERPKRSRTYRLTQFEANSATTKHQ